MTSDHPQKPPAKTPEKQGGEISAKINQVGFFHVVAPALGAACIKPTYPIKPPIPFTFFLKTKTMNRPNQLRLLTAPLRAAADPAVPARVLPAHVPPTHAAPLRMRVGPDGLLVPELPVTAPNVPRSRGRRVAAGMTVLFLGWAGLDFAVGRLVPLPEGVGGCLMACGLACSIMGLLWSQGVHKR